MKRWLLLIPLILLLAALALTVRAWLPPLLTFVGANTDLIQGLQAAAQIVLWVGAAGVTLFSYLTGRRQAAAPQAREPQPKPDTPEVRQTLHGTGVQAAGDVKVERDLVLGESIGTQINTGGGAYVGGKVDTGGGAFVGRDQINRPDTP